MIWWRIELDSTGAIRTCEQVEANAKNTNLVRFVEASTKAEACSSAKQWFQRRKDLRKAALKARVQRKKDAGLCTAGACKREPEPGRSQCTAHLRRHADAVIRQKRGEAQAQKHLTPETALLNHRGNSALHERLRMSLAKVLEKFDDCSPWEFRVWLVEEIERRTRFSEVAHG